MKYVKKTQWALHHTAWTHKLYLWLEGIYPLADCLQGPKLYSSQGLLLFPSTSVFLKMIPALLWNFLGPRPILYPGLWPLVRLLTKFEETKACVQSALKQVPEGHTVCIHLKFNTDYHRQLQVQFVLPIRIIYEHRKKWIYKNCQPDLYIL